MAKGTTYNLKRVKPGNGDGKKFYLDVGKVIVHEGGKTGALFLNHLDGDFALFRQDPKQTTGHDEAGGDS